MAAEVLSGLGDIALFAVPGTALSGFIPGLRVLPWPRRLAYGYLLGLAAVAGTLYAASHFMGLPLRGPVIWGCVALLTAAGLAAPGWRRASRTRPDERKSPISWFARLLRWTALASATVVTLGVAADAATDPVKDYDGRMTWCAQARYVRSAGTVDAPVLREASWFITHPHYPLLLPIAQVAAEEAYGAGEDTHAFRVLYAAFLPVLFLLLYDGARRFAGATAGSLAVLLASALPVLSEGEGSAATTYSDVPIACFYGAALLLLLCRRGRPGDGLGAGLLLAGGILSKNEGLPLALAALALGVFAPGLGGWKQRLRRRSPRLLLAALPALLALLLLLSWQAGIANRQDEDYLGLLSQLDWNQVLHQQALFVPVLGEHMVDRERWHGFWFALPLLLLLGVRALLRPLGRRLLLAALVPPAIAWAAYSVHWGPRHLAHATWDRCLLESFVPLLLLAGGAAVELLRLDNGHGERPQTPRRHLRSTVPASERPSRGEPAPSPAARGHEAQAPEAVKACKRQVVWVLARRFWSRWTEALIVVKPETPSQETRFPTPASS
jgi:Dolichyl-phosphate-mannose-protein mannosyltransferase